LVVAGEAANGNDVLKLVREQEWDVLGYRYVDARPQRYRTDQAGEGSPPQAAGTGA
jgi:hypothetical protein